MLPTVQKVVSFRQEQNIAYLKQRIGDFSPIFRKIRKHIQFEGRAATIHRHDDTSDPTKFQHATGEMTVRRAAMRAFGLPEVASAYDNVARQFAQQQEKMMIEMMNDVTAKTGNIVNGNGQPLGAEMLLELFEKMEHNFSVDGVWLPPTLWGAPEMTNAHAAAMADPAFQRELGKLLGRKRNEHRRREAGRILAG
ncbi:hypothetical protein [Pelagibacterium xiamenense]|uniref:hypothetical protein n=1 Tax=Pelagibacterium xiamenense TaxID=2901140 RepID=UPI001E3905F0|nr:hypothetical protein [Pelagibacterium xiamenense]MCD7059317.1 hypothetical protein [Pelagibacterium xiamenense]